MLDRIARRIEGKLQHKESVVDGGTPQQAHPFATKKSALDPVVAAPPALSRAPADASTVELVEAALKETRELVRIEIALAKLEAKQQLRQAVKAAVGFTVAAVFGIITLTLICVAIAFAIGANAPSALLLVAAVVLAIGAIAAFAGYSMLPKHPLERTRQHFEDDFKQLKEHVA